MQAKSEKRHRHRKTIAATPPTARPHQRVHAPQDHGGEHHIGANADKGLLANRNQPGKSRQHVPVHRQHQQRQNTEQILRDRTRRNQRNGVKAASDTSPEKQGQCGKFVEF